MAIQTGARPVGIREVPRLREVPTDSIYGCRLEGRFLVYNTLTEDYVLSEIARSIEIQGDELVYCYVSLELVKSDFEKIYDMVIEVYARRKGPPVSVYSVISTSVFTVLYFMGSWVEPPKETYYIVEIVPLKIPLAPIILLLIILALVAVFAKRR